MRKVIIIISVFLAGCIAHSFSAMGQEFAGPLLYNALLNGGPHSKAGPTMRTSASVLHLPFFEDFTGYSIYPDSSKWVEEEVYVNNVMCVSPVSRGVATFDALDKNGIPYDSFSNTIPIHCDSLTSRPVDLSLNKPVDSLYLSFFYQPQGNGYSPATGDSLFLFIKDIYGDYVLAWSVAGSALRPFKQVMIPITDTLYFHRYFQFRFVNIAALNFADADWNVDYIRLDTNRNMNDTLVNDIAWSSDPSSLLNDYTSMPYRQFMAGAAGETATNFYDSVHNDNNGPYFINYGYSAMALNTGTVLQAPVTAGPYPLSSSSIAQLSFPAYTTTVPLSAVGMYDKVVFENTFYLQPGTGTGNVVNDTIVKDQVFDNYLAYDDGSAEKSYYLNLFPTLPGRIAVEYHLNQPDTMRGLAIYFGRTIPLQSYKTFGIILYSSLAGVEGSLTDHILHQEDYLTPGYIDTINHFFVYKFDTAIALPAGTFYAGTIQYAESGDDSLYIGLDVNRAGSNHAFYNVEESWQPSLISGALMIRPLVGQDIMPSSTLKIPVVQVKWMVSPNPASDALQCTFEGAGDAAYRITDIKGQTIKEGKVANGKVIDIKALLPGTYLLGLTVNGVASPLQKIIKL